MSDDKLDRRDAIMAALEQAEEGSLEVPEEKAIEVVQDDISQEAAYEKARNEKGQFTKEEESVEYEASEDTEESVETPITRPSTWKKEYVQIWDKLEKGEQVSKQDFTKFAEYANQRESEYKKGVSTYKAEADRAREYENAIAPFVPELEQQGIAPAAWINNLGRAHMVLTKAPYEQKVQLFHKLAADYGIQLNNNGQAQQIDPYAQQLMSQLARVNQEVSTIKGRFAQEENQRLMSEIEGFKGSGKAPHFELVREEMAQLLELGKAQDLEQAYKIAIRMNDEAWSLEQEKLISQAKQQATKSQQVAKAKAAAVSPRSVTPNGQVAGGTDKKDRRALLAEQMEVNGSSRV